MGRSQSHTNAAPLAIAAGPSQDHQEHHRNRVHHQRGYFLNLLNLHKKI